MPKRFQKNQLSRRTFMQGLSWAPLLFVPAPLHGLFAPSGGIKLFAPPFLPYEDFPVTLHYPSHSPLDDVFKLIVPGGDEFVTEKYAFEIEALLSEWSKALHASPPAVDVLARWLDPSVKAASLIPVEEIKVRAQFGIDVVRRRFAGELTLDRERFVAQMKGHLAALRKIDTAEFQVIAIEEVPGSQSRFGIQIRYDLVAESDAAHREQRVGIWKTEWLRDPSNAWRITSWQGTDETLSRAAKPIFVDVTAQAFAQAPSYKSQMLHGTDYWRTVLDGACGIDVYGNNGVAAGDFDGDGLDDIYVCQPSGLPNRLYRNRGDGTFEDVTETSGLGVLDATACALFADFENKGKQDLLVVTSSGPLLFANQGNGKFSLKRDAFKFVRPPQGSFTHAAIADYDHDGRLDIYFCLYSYYAGLDQYRYPAPYFDARNGPPNFLFHNLGDGTFEDRTEAAGLNIDNDRYSFSCAWGDMNGNGWPDLYVANDFGRSNLYRNNGNGTFTSISTAANVEDAGAGMSACWGDFDGDGRQDIYVANMWSAAGMRISSQPIFHKDDPGQVRAAYRHHARGNSLYKNLGDGKFENVAEKAGAEIGRWAWSSDAWDFDHDGSPELYIANGYISGPQNPDLGSFFWRQVVGKSPAILSPSPNYERGWNAINELVRSDATWNGFERNVCYSNNHDGTFSDISGVVGLDFPDDSRAYALADLDHDGRLEIVLKNRNAPQLRILKNAMTEIGNVVEFRLRGTKSNRDAIGAAVTVEAVGHRQTKYLQAGTGFLSQHGKGLFFGIGNVTEGVRAIVRWPSGQTQTFDHIPLNRRVEIVEGLENFRETAFTNRPPVRLPATEKWKPETLPPSTATWLIEPLVAPNFSLPDASGKPWQLQSLRGKLVLLTLLASSSEAVHEQLRWLRQFSPQFAGGQILAVDLDKPGTAAQEPPHGADKSVFPVLQATEDFVGTYNIVFRYLFDRHRDLDIPTSFLINEEGKVIRVYGGIVGAEALLQDIKHLPRDPAARVQAALPFTGTLHQGEFQRNDFTYGIAFFQRGYLEQAAESFKQVLATRPDDADAYYNLGTLYLRRNSFPEARRNLERATELKPDYQEAWNNLGMLAAQEGHADEAVQNFKKSLSLRPDYAVALLNLGNLYRRQRAFAEAEQFLMRALSLQLDDPETNYSVGMFWAQQEQFVRAQEYLERAIVLRTDYADALNNLGVLMIREQHYAAAEEKFQSCIKMHPEYDQAYLNLARLYAMQGENHKAREVLQALLQLQPEHKMARQALEMLQ